MGFSPANSEMGRRLGTVWYMAPEQFDAELRGPVVAETDSWGFGCCIVEMLTGLPPWYGRSAEEVRKLVVEKQERPEIPSGLPAAMDDVLSGCFEYDLRDRPSMGDILQVLKRYSFSFSSFFILPISLAFPLSLIILYSVFLSAYYDSLSISSSFLSIVIPFGFPFHVAELNLQLCS